MGHCISKLRYSPPQKSPNHKRLQKQPINNPQSPSSSRIKTQSQYKKKQAHSLSKLHDPPPPKNNPFPPAPNKSSKDENLNQKQPYFENHLSSNQQSSITKMKDKGQIKLFVAINNKNLMMIVKRETKLSEFRKEKNLDQRQRFVKIQNTMTRIVQLAFEQLFTVEDILLKKNRNRHQIQIIFINIDSKLLEKLKKVKHKEIMNFPHNLNQNLLIQRFGFSYQSFIKINNDITLSWIRNALQLAPFEYFRYYDQGYNSIIQTASQNKIKPVEILIDKKYIYIGHQTL